MKASRNEILVLREVVKKLIPMLTERKLRVTQDGTQAYVRCNAKTNQPELINIPAINEGASLDFIRAIQGFLDHEVAHVLFTDFSLYGCDPRKPGSKTINPRFVNMHNIVEDTMIERLIVGKFPGSVKNLNSVREYYLNKIVVPALLGVDKQEEFQFLIVVILRALAGHKEMQRFMTEEKYWDNPFVKGFVEQIKPSTRELLKTCTTTKQTAQIAADILDIIGDDLPASPSGSSSKKTKDDALSDTTEIGVGYKNDEGEENNDDDGDNKDDKKGNGEKNKTGENDEETDSNDTVHGDRAEEEKNSESNDSDKNDAKGDETGEDEDNKNSKNNDDRERDDGDQKTDDENSGGTDVDGDVSSTTEGDTDEDIEENQSDVDVFYIPDSVLNDADMSAQISKIISRESLDLLEKTEYTVFSRDYDIIAPLPVNSKFKPEWVTEMQDEVMRMVGLMQKSLERSLASQNYVANIPGFKSGKLHAPSLYRLTTNDPRVFTQRMKAVAKDTVISLLIDNSGSMRGKKIKLAMLAGYALSETLERVKIKHDVIGFTSHERTAEYKEMMKALYEHEQINPGVYFNRDIPIYMPIYKDFNERITANVRKRMACAMKGNLDLIQNIDGESLLYEVDRISKQPEKRKIIIVISDGEPAGSTGAPQHLLEVTKSIEKAKQIELIGIGVLDDSVRDFYSNNIVINEIDELPDRVMTELRKILTN